MIKSSSLIQLDGALVEVIYAYTPSETRNQGHPDNRLPNEPSELLIVEVRLYDYDSEVLARKIKEQLNEEV